ncbi:DUF4097 family beta strand repeat-containing protein [Streptomyces colonosanans]|uniref:DUF4097 domain-containing protein n=1 Tax=Streptomyces colonosanans TaxID=1428652 RepID=A0A1S2NXE7_9ACTN|nr:DUF4097 family beta strand repeat-containing protein [Streptomyces colonosanans]OIJ86190.1 hypothetical protein BIV24_27140 [Streptomyces colonosanans]
MARTAARTGRTRRTKRARAVAVTGVVAVLVATAAACGDDAADDKHPDHRAFALHGRTLTVDSDNSALEIVPANVDKVEVTRWFRGTVLVGDDPRVTWAMQDDRLVLRVKCSGVVARCSARHRIEVPRGVAVKVDERNGSVRAQGVKEALSIRTRNGSVGVTDSTGPLTLDSHNGPIRATGVSSRRVHVETRNGPVHLELAVVPDQVEASSRNGSVSIALPQGSYHVTTDTHNGSTHVSVPQDPKSSHVIDTLTRNGSVTVRTAG